ncbi:MAG: Cytochrome, partial [Frankiales bacterium]|nr:Cytochrome [Frankiales bacterium]
MAELDFASPEFLADPYPQFAAQRAVAEVRWHEGQQLWLAFSHRAANAVLRARTMGRIWAPRWPAAVMPGFELLHVHSLLENEPPAHTRLRRLVAGAFARGHVERLRPRVAELAE